MVKMINPPDFHSQLTEPRGTGLGVGVVVDQTLQNGLVKVTLMCLFTKYFVKYFTPHDRSTCVCCLFIWINDFSSSTTMMQCIYIYQFSI